MGLNITTTYPEWFLIFCVLAGILFATALYYQNRKYEFSRTTVWILGAFRAIVISIIAFLLLNPLLNRQKKITEKPVILFLQDNSASIQTGRDSTFYQTEYPTRIEELISELGDKYEVETYDFSDGLSPGFSVSYEGNITNYSAVFDEIKDRYAYRNVGAMIVASDGIYNRGSNPVYEAEGLNFPVYTIALGDTNLKRDIILKNVSFNRIAYLGNEFPVEITIGAGKSKGLSTRLTISKDNEELYRKTIEINAENFLYTEKVLLEADEKGLQRYTVKLSQIDDEVNTNNNQQDIFVDILEGKQKILLLAQAPHPDISAIKQAILSNKNYEFEEFIIDKFDKSVSGYNLIILHGLPTLSQSISGILEKIRDEQIPTWYILTQKTYYQLFNEQLGGVSVRGENLIYNEVQPTLNDDFSLFSIAEPTRELLAQVPPVVSPYGAIGLQPSATPLFYQKIGSVETTEPLFVLNETTEMKSGVLLGEGIWKWRMKSWALNQSHQPFDNLINKVVQFLSLKVDKRFFRVIHKNNFEENENIEFEAQVYNDIYELVNNPEVKMVISDQEGNEFPYIFNRTNDAYHLNAGRLSPGTYTYNASVLIGDKLLTDQGEFTVSQITVELTNTVADHNLLYNLAKSRGGEMYFPDQLGELEAKIQERDDIKTITYRQKQYSEVLNIAWLMVFILVMLSTEWFIRKRDGEY
ncbi:MAG: hypothetical protein KQI35_02525 [Bacteroidetes bacterium]|nr:hypothetical protein [Bacteroidota bacterium]